MSRVLVEGTPEQRVALVAGAQRGRVSRRQLLAAGLSSATIGRLLAAGSLWPEHRGVYAVGHRAQMPGSRETSALLAMRPGGALSHLTALRWWTMVRSEHPSDSSSGEAHPPVHLTLAGDRARGPVDVMVHRSRILTARDLRIRDGVPVTSPARALLDVAAVLPARELERALDTGLVRRVVSLRDVHEILGRAGRHDGRASLQALVDAHLYTTFTRSEAEELFLALIRQAGLAVPLVNHRHLGYEVDFWWPGSRVAVEIDGYAFHRGRAAFEADRRRDAALQAAGVAVIRITYRRLTDAALAVVAELAPLLAVRT